MSGTDPAKDVKETIPRILFDFLHNLTKLDNFPVNDHHFNLPKNAKTKLRLKSD